MKGEFVLEIGVEELPARHCLLILSQLSDASIANLAKSHNLSFDNQQLFISPRRIALTASAVSPISTQTDVKGPLYKIAFENGKPTKIGTKFAQSHGLTPDQLEKRDVNGKQFAYATKSLEDNVDKDISNFAIALIESIAIDKPMSWDESGFRFSRPIRWILCLMGKNIVPISFIDLESNRKTVGPRFLDSPDISITTAKQYEDALAKHKVIVDHTKRKRLIKRVLNQLQDKQGLEVVDEGDKLLDEVTHLVEYPHPIVCSFDSNFLKLPSDVISTVLSSHQKYFPLINSKTKKMSSTFLVIANYDKDSTVIKKGNETVVHARLRDAVFFYEQDRKISLKEFAQKTGQITFQEKLGSMKDKMERIEKIAVKLAKALNIEDMTVKKAAQLCKADLSTNMVNEFSTLEGTIGQIYAEKDGLDHDISLAIKEHYLPRHSGDTLPTSDIGIVLSLADKIDSLYGLTSIGIKPKGNSDPYGVRRAAISIIRILWETELLISLDDLIDAASSAHKNKDHKDDVKVFLLSRIERYLRDAIEDKIYPDTDVLRSVIYNTDPMLINKKLALSSITKQTSTNEFTQITELLKRIYNIAIKGKELKKVILNKSELNASETSFLNAISALSKKDPLEFKDLYALIVPGTTFFDENMVMSENKTEKANRLEILRQAHYVILRVINPEYLLS